jgi:hypothetical protein
MRINRIFLLAVVPLIAAACADADRTGEMADSIAVAPDVDAGGSPTGDTITGDADAGAGMQATVALNALQGSGVTGEATVAPEDAAGQTRVNVTLQAADAAGGVHQGHIHQGTCASIGSVVVPLPPVTVAGGTGTATSSVAVDAMSVMDGNHVVAYHQAGGNPGAPAVCGEIPGHEM